MFGPLGEMKEIREEQQYESRRERRHREEKAHVERQRMMLAITDERIPQEPNIQRLNERRAPEEVLDKRRRLLDDVPLSFQRPAFVAPAPLAPLAAPTAAEQPTREQPTRQQSEIRRELLNDVPLGFRRPAPYEPRAFVVGRTVMLVGKAKGKELIGRR